jgi:hypothetical protein
MNELLNNNFVHQLSQIQRDGETGQGFRPCQQVRRSRPQPVGHREREAGGRTRVRGHDQDHQRHRQGRKGIGNARSEEVLLYSLQHLVRGRN